MRSGGRVLVDALSNNKISTIFGVPGESYLEVLDALYEHPSIKYITCRHEGGAAYMAEADSKLTSRPGVCFVTRGPGAANASIGIHTAFQNSTPLILLVGQVPRQNLEREAFQEIDYRRMFGQMAKWVAQIDEPARIPEFINRAFHTALSGRPGPVVLALPEDMLREQTEVQDLPPASPVQASPSDKDIDRLHNMLSASSRPLFIVGGSIWTDTARHDLEVFARRNNLPVSAAFRRQDLFDNHHECYAGDLAWGPIPSLRKAIEQADLIVAMGARMNDGTTSKYTCPAPTDHSHKFIHIYPEAAEFGRVYQADLMIASGVCEAAAALENMGLIKGSEKWGKWNREIHQGYLDSLDPGPQPGTLDMGQVMGFLRQRLPAKTIVTNGAGNYADWPNKIYQYDGIGTLLAPISGAMGGSVPAAVAASIRHPDRLVLGFAGDGDFLMNGQELAVAMQHGVTPIILVINNNMYGTIRMHQQKYHPGRISGTPLVNPDFATFARAFGAYGEKVEQTEDFEAAFERAVASGKPAVLELVIDPECICINMPKLSQLDKG